MKSKKCEVKCKECGKIFYHTKKLYCTEECRGKAKYRRDRERIVKERKKKEKKAKINPYFLVRGKISYLRRGDSFQHNGMN